MTTNNQVLIITGMHRSGTSLTAAYVQAMGLELGNNLLPGSYWNPRGYYEDRELVAFSRKVLRECCGSHKLEFKEWGWTARESLDREVLRFYLQPARKLVDRREPPKSPKLGGLHSQTPIPPLSKGGLGGIGNNGDGKTHAPPYY